MTIHVLKLSIWFALISLATLRIIEEENVNTVTTEAVQGGLARLPCDLTPTVAQDKVYLVIWYKEGHKSPIYSFDSRDARGNNLPDKSVHWADETVLAGRAFFQATQNPATLAIEGARDSDTGAYHCRVDFQRSRTRYARVNLTVIVPPEQLSILDEDGSHIPHYVLGPYDEGDNINVTCVATGGKPSPAVTWWQDNTLLDDSYSTLSEGRVKNVLQLKGLQRRHLNSVFTCQASNNNLTTPITSDISLDLNLRPLWVKITSPNRPMSAESTYEVTCEIVGARPRPVVTWWKASVPLRNHKEVNEGNKTISILKFVPTIEDNGKHLSCRGESVIPESGLEDGWKLDIHHVPSVTLELGSNQNASHVYEGVDVYFECNIKSNPWVYKVSWRHNGNVIYNNIGAGVIISNQSLVLQNVGRSKSGLYTCVGSNQEGDGESNPVQLDIKYAPVCRPGQMPVYNVARQETIQVSCELQANPGEVTFKWLFNNTNSEVLSLPISQISTEKTHSIMQYTPQSEQDYGTLMCWGINEVGTQQDPCVFMINPAGKPDSLSNCTIVNQTAESLHVECTEGYDGGLPQQFLMEVYTVHTRQLVSSVTSRTPYFSVTGLDSELGFDIVLAAINAKGRSKLAHLNAYALKFAERQTATIPSMPHMTTFMGALIGGVSAIVLLAAITVITVRLRGRSEDIVRPQDHSPDRSATPRCNNAYLDHPVVLEDNRSDMLDYLEEKNPDIIPQGGEDVCLETRPPCNWLGTTQRSLLYGATPGSSQCPPSLQPPPPTAMYLPYKSLENLSQVNDTSYAELYLSAPSQRAVYTTSTLNRARVSKSGMFGPTSQPLESTLYAQISLNNATCANDNNLLRHLSRPGELSEDLQ
ncbi:nephrin-like [Ctenocephalides felis]|uniref:nephrin-like n=1 Tax=Ctenocephalides felis TaxID=7515 RepID=UPI000E6E1038|nr:nephrin-like [Ctenocephalides felis]